VILLIVFIHQLLCIKSTKEQLPDMNFCHPLQENISSFFFLATPLQLLIISRIYDYDMLTLSLIA